MSNDEQDTTPSLEWSFLSDEQLARVEALTAARTVLVEHNVFKSGKAEPSELISVSMYIETGNDPYGPNPS